MTNQTQTALEQIISQIVGAPVEITIRGEKSFTFSTETVVADLGDKIAAFMNEKATLVSVTTEHDDECGSFAYADALI